MSKETDQIPMFEMDQFDIQRGEWEGMPEYNNIQEKEPSITATFKFRNEEDFLKFKNLVQEYVYHGEKVFDGMQTLEAKSTWYPHKERPKKYVYV